MCLGLSTRTSRSFDKSKHSQYFLSAVIIETIGDTNNFIDHYTFPADLKKTAYDLLNTFHTAAITMIYWFKNQFCNV